MVYFGTDVDRVYCCIVHGSIFYSRFEQRPDRVTYTMPGNKYNRYDLDIRFHYLYRYGIWEMAWNVRWVCMPILESSDVYGD